MKIKDLENDTKEDFFDRPIDIKFKLPAVLTINQFKELQKRMKQNKKFMIRKLGDIHINTKKLNRVIMDIYLELEW